MRFERDSSGAGPSPGGRPPAGVASATDAPVATATTDLPPRPSFSTDFAHHDDNPRPEQAVSSRAYPYRPSPDEPSLSGAPAYTPGSAGSSRGRGRSKVRKMSLEEFERRQHEIETGQDVLTPFRLAKRESEALASRHALTADDNHLQKRYRRLFFSDHVNHLYHPVQAFLPGFYARSESATESAAMPAGVAALDGVLEWWRTLKRDQAMKHSAPRHKVWDHYERPYDEARAERMERVERTERGAAPEAETAKRADAAGAPADGPADVPAPAPSPAATGAPGGSGRRGRPHFEEWAHPVPSLRQFELCRSKSGRGVWDSFGVWRCLVPDEHGGFDFGDDASKMRLFDRYDDYLAWKSAEGRRAASEAEEEAPAAPAPAAAATPAAPAGPSIPGFPGLARFPSLTDLMRCMERNGRVEVGNDGSWRCSGVDGDEPAEAQAKASPAPRDGAKEIATQYSTSVQINPDGTRTTKKKVRRFYDDGSSVESDAEPDSDDDVLQSLWDKVNGRVPRPAPGSEPKSFQDIQKLIDAVLRGDKSYSDEARSLWDRMDKVMGTFWDQARRTGWGPPGPPGKWWWQDEPKDDKDKKDDNGKNGRGGSW
ncbi:uncharacterized protein V1510DRAFT_416145 [Dipodascopsis tothii]|uniref:uncharacterized protein n=1 Tax=Dipodascopsis tothii TaxID=44089 RepID=UPI0034CD4036